MWRIFSMMIVVLLVLSACDTGDNSEDSDEPVARPGSFNQTPIRDPQSVFATADFETAVAGTQTALPPTPTSPPTFNPDRIVTFTPEPVFTTTDSDDIIGNTFEDRTWRQYNMTFIDGGVFSFENYEDTVVIAMLVDTACSQCVAQQQIVRNGAEIVRDQLGASGINYAFLSLSINTSITIESLAFISQRDGYGFSTDLNWQVAAATPILRSAIGDTFGEEVLTAETLPVIFVDRDGFGHLTDVDRLDEFRIRDAVIFYGADEDFFAEE